MCSPHYQLDKHSLTTKKSKLGVGKHVAKTNSSSSTEQHLDSRASWIVALGMSLNVNLSCAGMITNQELHEYCTDIYECILRL